MINLNLVLSSQRSEETYGNSMPSLKLFNENITKHDSMNDIMLPFTDTFITLKKTLVIDIYFGQTIK